MPARNRPVTIEAPGEPHPPEPSVPPEPEPTPPTAAPEPAPTRSGKVKVSQDGRRLLREACAAVGVDAAKGNSIADWLDKHPNAVVTITGQTPEPPLRVFGTPDPNPMIDRRAVPDRAALEAAQAEPTG